MFCSVRQLAKARGVSPQAILEGISLGRYEAIQVGHDWRIFGVGGNYDKIQRTRTCRRRVKQIRIDYDTYRAFLLSAGFEEGSEGQYEKGNLNLYYVDKEGYQILTADVIRFLENNYNLGDIRSR